MKLTHHTTMPQRIGVKSLEWALSGVVEIRHGITRPRPACRAVDWRRQVLGEQPSGNGVGIFVRARRVQHVRHAIEPVTREQDIGADGVIGKELSKPRTDPFLEVLEQTFLRGLVIVRRDLQ